MAELKLDLANTRAKRSLQFSRARVDICLGDIVIRMLGVFLAMAVPLPGMAPFGLSFLAQERKFSVKAVITFAFISIGGVIACGRLGALKYIGAGVLYLSALFVLERGIKFNDVAAGITAGVCVFATGFATLCITGFGISEFLLLLCETAIIAAATLMLEKSSEFLQKRNFSARNVDSDTKLSLGAILAVAVLSLRQIYIGSEFSIMNFAAAVVLLVVASGCGPTYSTGTGVVLGLVCGIGNDYFMAVLGAFSFCGFLAGVFSKHGKGGAVAGIMLANGVMAVYTNNATQSVLSIFEVLASSFAFAFIPASFIEAVKEILYFGEPERESIGKMKESLKNRLNAVAKSFDGMAKTLEKLSDKSIDDENAEVTSVFDATADRVCRKCRKATVCWGRDFNSTYDDMFAMLGILNEMGKISETDVREHFAIKCVNVSGIVTEINHQFDIYRLKSVWKNKLGESREIVGEQLSGMSKIIDGLADELTREIKPATVSAWEVRTRLERRGIKPRDVNVMQEKNGRHKIEIVLKGESLKEKQRSILEKLMKTILRCPVVNTEENICGKKYIRLCFSEAERYKVETRHASYAAAEKNGDNFRMLHLNGGKYVVAISDGMGTGSRAAKESEAILELLDSFLQAGFDSRTAIRLLNSIMIMKSDGGSFVTIDLCIIDLYTGEVKFLKTGAEPSFIMQKSGLVEMVNGASLPVGIVTEAEADVKSRKICEGDRIVMITDGVESRENGSLWVSEFIRKNCRSKQDENLVDDILKYAIEKNSETAKDDMTVLSIELKAVAEKEQALGVGV